MARETKQERTVKAIFDQVSEHLHQLKILTGNSVIKEMDVERWAESLLRSCLGYSATNGYSIRAQETRGKMRPDLIVSKADKAIFVVEVKRLGFDLNKADFRSGKLQLGEYLRDFPDVRWGFLTNGIDWKLFDFSSRESGGVEVIAIDLKSESGDIDISKRGVDETCWELYDFHENCFADNSWDELYREASAFSPDSLSKAILSAEVVKAITKSIRGEHEYKANTEALYDRLVDLVINGLDDTDPAWNDTKRLELNNFVKSQKRASNKKRRAIKREDAASTAKPDNVPTAQENTNSVQATVPGSKDPDPASGSNAA